MSLLKKHALKFEKEFYTKTNLKKSVDNIELTAGNFQKHPVPAKIETPLRRKRNPYRFSSRMFLKNERHFWGFFGSENFEKNDTTFRIGLQRFRGGRFLSATLRRAARPALHHLRRAKDKVIKGKFGQLRAGHFHAIRRQEQHTRIIPEKPATNIRKTSMKVQKRMVKFTRVFTERVGQEEDRSSEYSSWCSRPWMTRFSTLSSCFHTTKTQELHL